MRSSKAAGPLCIVVEMLKASGETSIDLVTELANAIVNEDVVPVDRAVNSIVHSYTGKVDALERGNYMSLKLLEHVRKVDGRIFRGQSEKR